MTHTYEALVILRTAGTEHDLAKHTATLEDPVKKNGGSVTLSQGIGRRRLAYRISRQAEGHYHLLRFQAPSDRLKDIERLYRLNDAIVRFMILNAEELGATADTITSASPSPAGGAFRSTYRSAERERPPSSSQEG